MSQKQEPDMAIPNPHFLFGVHALLPLARPVNSLMDWFAARDGLRQSKAGPLQSRWVVYYSFFLVMKKVIARKIKMRELYSLIRSHFAF